MSQRFFTIFAGIALFFFPDARSSLAQAITSVSFTPAAVCPGSDIDVSFTTTGTFTAGNTFTIQLSNAAGAFGANPVVLGTTTTNTKKVTVPSTTTLSNAYKIRVVSSAPVKNATSTSDLSVQNLAAPTVTDPAAVCQGSQVSASVLVNAVSGYSGDLVWYAAASGGSGSSTPPTPVTTSAGVKKYYVSQATAACESPRAEITLTVNPTPVAPTTSDLPDACQGETVTSAQLAAKVSGYTGQLLWYTAATGGTGSTSTPTPDTGTAGEKKYHVSQKVNGCESPRSVISLTVLSAATPTVSDLPDACQGETVTSAQLAAKVNGYTGQLVWYTTASGGTGSSTAPTPNTTTLGTKKFYVSQKIGACESTRATISLTVVAVPAAPTVSDLPDVCQGETVTSAQLAAKVTNVSGQLIWYTAPTDGTGTTQTPTPNTSTSGDKKFYVSQKTGNCESPRAVITLTVKPAAAAPTVVTPVNACFGETPAPVLSATGTGLKWYTSPTGTGSTTKPVISTNTAGTRSYYVTQTVNGCESPKAEIKVQVFQTIKPVVTATIQYCKGAAPAALVATGTALKWYTTATGGTGTPTAPVVSTAAEGTQTYYVTQTLNGCESDRARIDVIVKPVPAAPTTANLADVCQNTPVTATQLLNAVKSATGTLKWYSAATGGTGQSTPFTPVTTTAGTKSYYVTQTVNGCESERAQIDLVVKTLPAAPTVVATADFCYQAPAKPLEATAATGNTLSWYTVATGGTPLATAPTPPTTAVKNIDYFVSQSQKYSATLSCEGPRAKITAVINPLPAAPTTTDQVVCQTKGDEELPYKAVAASGNSLLWAPSATGGTETTTTPTVNLKTHGEYQYYVSQKSSKSCVGPRKVVKIRVKRLPGLPNTTPPSWEYCQFDQAKPLVATPETSAIIKWYGQNSTGGSASPTAPVPSTEEGGNFSYYVSQTLEGCEGDRAEIKVLIKTTPKPGVTSPIYYCVNAPATPLTATGEKLLWYRPNGESRTDPYTPFTEAVGDQFFYVTQTGSNGCQSPKAEIKITIKPLPSATISGTSSIPLGGSASIKIDFTGDGPWNYQLSDGTKGATDHNPLVIQVRPSTTTSYLVTEVSNSCGKGIPNGSAVVTVLIPTITTGNANVTTICAGKQLSIPFQRSGDFPSDNKFLIQLSTENQAGTFKSIPTTISGNIATGTIPDTLAGGAYFVRIIGQSEAGTVIGSISGVNVTVKPLPVATLSENKTILIGETAEIPVVLTGEAPWAFSYTDGTTVFPSINTSTSPYVLTVKPETTTVYKITGVTNACGSGIVKGESRIQVDPILGVEPGKAGWVKVRPTLVDASCLVEIEDALAPDAALSVLDMTGRKLYNRSLETKVTEISTSGLPSGIYLLQIRNGNERATIKILKP